MYANGRGVPQDLVRLMCGSISLPLLCSLEPQEDDAPAARGDDPTVSAMGAEGAAVTSAMEPADLDNVQIAMLGVVNHDDERELRETLVPG